MIHEKVYALKNGEKTKGKPIDVIAISASSNLRRIRRYRPDISGKKYIAVIYEVEGENYDKE